MRRGQRGNGVTHANAVVHDLNAKTTLQALVGSRLKCGRSYPPAESHLGAARAYARRCCKLAASFAGEKKEKNCRLRFRSRGLFMTLYDANFLLSRAVI